MTCDYIPDDITETKKKPKVNDYYYDKWRRYPVSLITNSKRDLYVILTKQEFRTLNQFLAKYEFEMPKDPKIFADLPEKVRKIIHNWMQMGIS